MLSSKELIAMNRYRLGGAEAWRTPTYHVDCKTIGALMRKGYLDRQGATSYGRDIMAQFDETTPVTD